MGTGRVLALGIALLLSACSWSAPAPPDIEPLIPAPSVVAERYPSAALVVEAVAPGPDTELNAAELGAGRAVHDTTVLARVRTPSSEYVIATWYTEEQPGNPLGCFGYLGPTGGKASCSQGDPHIPIVLTLECNRNGDSYELFLHAKPEAVDVAITTETGKIVVVVLRNQVGFALWPASWGAAASLDAHDASGVVVQTHDGCWPTWSS